MTFPAARPWGHSGRSGSRAGQSKVEEGTNQQTEDCVLLLLAVGTGWPRDSVPANCSNGGKLKAKWLGPPPQSRAEVTVSPCLWQLLAFCHNECMYNGASYIPRNPGSSSLVWQRSLKGLQSGPAVREHREGHSQSWSTASEAISSGNNSELLPTTPVSIFNELKIKNTCLLPIT